MIAIRRGSIRIIDRASILKSLLIAVMLIGGFSLERLGAEFEHFGILGQARYVLALLLILMMLGDATKRGLRFPSATIRRFVLLFMGLHVYVAVSILWSSNYSSGISQLPDIFLLISLVAAGAMLFSDEAEKNIRLILGIIFNIAVALTVAGVAVYGYQMAEGSLALLGGGGIGSARLQGMAILAAIFFFIESGSFAWLAPAPILLLGMFYSGSRASVAALAISVLILIVPLIAKLRNKVRVPVILGSLAVIGVLFTLPLFRESLEFFLRSCWVNQESESGIYLADRDRIYADALGIFFENPQFGIGLGSYYGQVAGENYPHNLILNVAVDCGIGGVGILVLIIGLLVARAFRPTSPEHHMALAAGMFYFVASMLAGTYYDARLMWLFFLLFMLPVARIPSLPLGVNQNGGIR